MSDNKMVTRGELVDNEELVTKALSHLGCRVSVKVLEVHVASLYELMSLNVPRDSAVEHSLLDDLYICAIFRSIYINIVHACIHI